MVAFLTKLKPSDQMEALESKVREEDNVLPLTLSQECETRVCRWEPPLGGEDWVRTVSSTLVTYDGCGPFSMQGTVLEPTRRCEKDAEVRLAIRLLGQQEVGILEFDPEKENTVGCDLRMEISFGKSSLKSLRGERASAIGSA